MIYSDKEICIAESLDKDKYFLFRDRVSDICFVRNEPTEVPFKIIDGQVKSEHQLTQIELNIIKKLIKNGTITHNTQSNL
jgi:hypothetical protein